MIPVTHRGCGGQIGWYLRDTPRELDMFLAQDFQRLDGTHPKNGDRLLELCPRCGDKIAWAGQMVREFGEKIDD